MTTPENGGAAGRLLLRSVRVDNYKCLDGVEVPFSPVMTLLLGRNGCGKTAVFDAVNALHWFACRDRAPGDLFSTYTLTRWGDNDEQSFELRVGEEGGGEFRYRLAVHRPEESEGEAYVKSETLTLDDKPLLDITDGKMQMYADDHSETSWVFIAENMSGLGIARHNKNSHLGRFYDWLRGVALLSLEPTRIKAISEAEKKEDFLDADGGNFVPWYRWTTREGDAMMAEANAALAHVLPGYCGLQLAKVSRDARELRAVFKSESGVQQEYAFYELSPGQRVLIVLYCFLHGGDRNRLLLIDEPDNFVTLPEVQPLLFALEDEAGDELPQVAMISHHPSVIDSVSPRDTVWMAREPEQPARVVEFENDTMLHTSTLFAQDSAP